MGSSSVWSGHMLFSPSLIHPQLDRGSSRLNIWRTLFTTTPGEGACLDFQTFAGAASGKAPPRPPERGSFIRTNMASSVWFRRAAVLRRASHWISAPKPAASLISNTGLVFQTASYNPKPLKRNIHEPYIPDKVSESTPEWQKTAHYDRKLFGRYGSASGVDPASLWPSHKELDKMIAEENEWHPPLDVMRQNIAARDKQETETRLAKERLIAANMAKMPKMVADWRKEKRESKVKLKEEKDRRSRLLAEARERFGYAVDPRTPKFLEMVAEIEKEEKKKKKLLKRRQKEEQETGPVTPPAAAS
ncbi:large ribosomal subunit protein mL64 [Eucyclogobius newberryi]|uniref:large ribosomal subunit protein mL64 n=1 Tax=Eucyclogobius newberryi TaxID=166745 RepID=UPI003B5B2A7A